jgi:cell pole-organizing protein PopZ
MVSRNSTAQAVPFPTILQIATSLLEKSQIHSSISMKRSLEQSTADLLKPKMKEWDNFFTR